MAVHRAESIMVAVLAKITNLTTTGENFKRGRYYPWPEATAASIELWQGDDEPLDDDDRNIAFTDSWLTINTDVVVKATDDAETTLNKIRSEITVALLADYTQGLGGFVMDTVEGPAEAPVHDSDGEKPVLRQRLQWRIKYRRNTKNPTT